MYICNVSRYKNICTVKILEQLRAKSMTQSKYCTHIVSHNRSVSRIFQQKVIFRIADFVTPYEIVIVLAIENEEIIERKAKKSFFWNHIKCIYFLVLDGWGHVLVAHYNSPRNWFFARNNIAERHFILLSAVIS